MEYRPLLFFNTPENTDYKEGHGGVTPLPKITPERKQNRNNRISSNFENAINLLHPDLSGDTTKILVIETVGKRQDFYQAVKHIPNLEWMSEYDIDEIGYLDELYEKNSKEYSKAKSMGGRVYLSSSNYAALQEIFRLYNNWKNGLKLERGKSAWKKFFEAISDLRFWSVKDRLEHTGILELLKEELEIKQGTISSIDFDIELHFWKNLDIVEKQLNILKENIKKINGIIINTYRNEDIAYHALKVSLPVTEIHSLLAAYEYIDLNEPENRFSDWIKSDLIKYCRYTPQQILEGIVPEKIEDYEIQTPLLETPVIALLDGAPLSNHKFLKDFILIDDPDNYTSNYTPEQQKHGTTMASLICHNDLNNPTRKSIDRKIYVRPIMYPNSQDPKKLEKIPIEMFPEDIIEKSIVRIFEDNSDSTLNLKSIKIINLSVGNDLVQFNRELSPWARLLDWLAYKYKILFIISAGNYNSEKISKQILEKNETSENNIFSESKSEIKNLLKLINETHYKRKIISPAESINNITVGALHFDYSQITDDHLVDIYSNKILPAVYSRLGNGFRSQIKPDILVPGGKQLYQSDDTYYIQARNRQEVGQKVCSVGYLAEEISYTTHTIGTSNAAALTTHAAAHIYEMLEILNKDNNEIIEDEYIALMIKSLLVHGSSWRDMTDYYEYLKDELNSRTIKRTYASHLGYGIADFERVSSCTDKRVTLLGFGKLSAKTRHKFKLEIDDLMRIIKYKLICTMAYFTPIDQFSYRYREAKLFFELNLKQEKKAKRLEGDGRQVQNGTLQHEIFDIKNLLDEENIEIYVQCNPDANQKLDLEIPYALSVTLEALQEVEIDLYETIKNKIQSAIDV